MRAAAVLVLFAAACQRPTAPAPAAGAASAPAPLSQPGPACGPDTPLVEGVPGSPGHLIKSGRNPNGDSELAALMRVMQDDLNARRDAVLRGDPVPPLGAAHGRLRCSWPTDATMRRDPFDRLAVAYLEAEAAFDAAATAEDRRMAFGLVVNACLTCHQSSCPGPIAAIQKLDLPPP